MSKESSPSSLIVTPLSTKAKSQQTTYLQLTKSNLIEKKQVSSLGSGFRKNNNDNHTNKNNIKYNIYVIRNRSFQGCSQNKVLIYGYSFCSCLFKAM